LGIIDFIELRASRVGSLSNSYIVNRIRNRVLSAFGCHGVQLANTLLLWGNGKLPSCIFRLHYKLHNPMACEGLFLRWYNWSNGYSSVWFHFYHQAQEI